MAIPPLQPGSFVIPGSSDAAAEAVVGAQRLRNAQAFGKASARTELPSAVTSAQETQRSARGRTGEAGAQNGGAERAWSENADGDAYRFTGEASAREGAGIVESSAPRSRTGEPLSPEERQEVEKLAARDREVRAHEQAHVAAAGPLYRGGPRYEYREGPDGKRYAVGGSVQIDTAAVPDDPEATAQKARRIQRAALAPQSPSSEDRRVAAEARAMEAQAQREIARENMESAEAARSASSAGVSGRVAVLDPASDRPAAGAGPPRAPEAGSPERPLPRVVSAQPRYRTESLGSDLPGPPDLSSVVHVKRSQLPSRPTETLYTRPSEALYSRPSDVLYTRPSEALAAPARLASLLTPVRD